MVVTFVEFTARRRAEDELRRSEERYRLLVEGVAEYAMIMTDADGRITTWNSGARKIFGRSEAESLGQPLALLFTEEDRAAGVAGARPRDRGQRRPGVRRSVAATEGRNAFLGERRHDGASRHQRRAPRLRDDPA